MTKQMNLSSQELQTIIGGNGLANYFNGNHKGNKPIIGLPTPVKPKIGAI